MTSICPVEVSIICAMVTERDPDASWRGWAQLGVAKAMGRQASVRSTCRRGGWGNEGMVLVPFLDKLTVLLQ